MQMDFNASCAGNHLQRCVDRGVSTMADPCQTRCCGKSWAKIKKASASTHLSSGPWNPALRGRLSEEAANPPHPV